MDNEEIRTETVHKTDGRKTANGQLIQDSMKRYGWSRTTAYRKTSHADKLDYEFIEKSGAAPKIRNSQIELRRLAELEPEIQKEVLKKLGNNEADSVNEALGIVPPMRLCFDVPRELAEKFKAELKATNSDRNTVIEMLLDVWIKAE